MSMDDAKNKLPGGDFVNGLKDAIYACCANQSAKLVFSRDDLLEMKIIPHDDKNLLRECTSQLARARLFKPLTRKDGEVCWSFVAREEAAKFKKLNVEESLIYSCIEGSGRDGIWSRTIERRTNLHRSLTTRCLKSLESKHYIKKIKNSQHPSFITYIISSLQPSEDITADIFHTDGDLDEEFVKQVSRLAERYIISRSWYFPPTESTKKFTNSSKATKESVKGLAKDLAIDLAKDSNSTKMSEDRVKALRAKELGNAQDIEDVGRAGHESIAHWPPGYTGYPTLPEITKAVNASKVIKVVLTEAEMLRILDVLRWDDKILKVKHMEGYQAVPNRGNVESALTQVPCGRCPVSDLCEENGPVNARTCDYFTEWLAK